MTTQAAAGAGQSAGMNDQPTAPTADAPAPAVATDAEILLAALRDGTANAALWGEWRPRLLASGLSPEDVRLLSRSITDYQGVFFDLSSWLYWGMRLFMACMGVFCLLLAPGVVFRGMVETRADKATVFTMGAVALLMIAGLGVRDVYRRRWATETRETVLAVLQEYLLRPGPDDSCPFVAIDIREPACCLLDGW